MAASNSSLRTPPAFTALSSLVEEGDVAIKVMVCRSWDVKNPAGKYIGTEYIFSDDAGNALHCIARSAIAHCVVSKLQTGCIYSIRRFTLSPNKATYKLRQHDTHLINLESNTIITKIECSVDGFVAQPFVLQALEEIAFNDNKFLIDVIGRPINLGTCKPTRNGSQFLEFDLHNERGHYVKVTLWGALGDQLLSCIRNEGELTVVVLPAMSVRAYKGGLHLSSTSGTLIYDTDDIPELAALRSFMRSSIPVLQQNYGTLREILNLGRAQVGANNVSSVALVCRAKVVGIRPKTPWNYYSCGEKGCKKGVTPQGTQFWCDSCEKICVFPIVRFLLRLEVLDDSTSVCVTVFDEIAESLVKKSAADLIAAMQGNEEEMEYPTEIISLIGTFQDLELKSHTYYNHGQYESFTVTRVLTPSVDSLANKPPSGSADNVSSVPTNQVDVATVVAGVSCEGPQQGADMNPITDPVGVVRALDNPADGLVIEPGLGLAVGDDVGIEPEMDDLGHETGGLKRKFADLAN